VLLVGASASGEWQSEVGSEITIQVRPSRRARHRARPSRRRRRRCGAQAGNRRSEALHQGRIGQIAGAVAWQRSVVRRNCRLPRVIVAPGAQPGHHARSGGAALEDDTGGRRPPASTIHRAWIERMRSMTGGDRACRHRHSRPSSSIATIISVSFATRGAMAANRPIVRSPAFSSAPATRYIANRFFPAFPAAGALEGGRDRRRRGDARFRLLRNRSPAGFPAHRVGDQFAAICWERFRCALRVI